MGLIVGIPCNKQEKGILNLDIPDFIQRVPVQYPIRHYPDIAHGRFHRNLPQKQ
jgi:hypothetical protein